MPADLLLERLLLRVDGQKTSVRLAAALMIAGFLAACDPSGFSSPAGVDQIKYERNKANREAYLSQRL